MVRSIPWNKSYDLHVIVIPISIAAIRSIHFGKFVYEKDNEENGQYDGINVSPH